MKSKKSKKSKKTHISGMSFGQVYFKVRAMMT